MSFVRTPSGLKNFRLFKRVEFILFSEGGRTQFSAIQALGGDCNEKSLDGPFWGNLISHVRPLSKFSVKPVGSKSTLLEILNRVQNHSIPNIFLAADRDFEGLHTSRRRAPCYVCTWGYSWENSVHTLSNLEAFTKKHYVHDPNRKAIALQQIRKAWRNFKRTAERFVRFDSAGIQSGCGGFFDRAKDGKDLFGTSYELSSVNIKRRVVALRASMPQAKIINIPPVSQAWRYCYGKLIAAFTRKLFRSIFEVKHSDDAIDSMLLMTLADSFGSPSSQMKYYIKKLDKLLP